MTTYDAIIIGTGQAGPALARRLAGAGMNVAIVERGRFGGTCVNTGCTPTKALVASAHAAHMVRRAGEFGVMVDGNPGLLGWGAVLFEGAFGTALLWSTLARLPRANAQVQ